MNKKFIPWIIFLLGTSFVFGAIIGLRWSYRELSLTAKSENSGHVMYDVNLLNLLRTNNTAKAIENLEGELDSDLVRLDQSMSNSPSSPIIDPFVLTFIQDAKKYRQHFPHSNCDTNVDQEISNLFLLVNSPTNK